MPKYVHQKKVEAAVDAVVARTQYASAHATGWTICPACSGQPLPLDEKGRKRYCLSCMNLGRVPTYDEQYQPEASRLDALIVYTA